ncbi:MAG TPA: cupin domain-containing protein [Acidobacteriaceae bacterium]|jgi:quercetin dioxygenase-like cupin family protein
MVNNSSNTQETTASSEKDVFVVLGTLLQFLSTPNQNRDDVSVMMGSIPSGIVVPLHSHGDPEIFYILDGAVEVYEGPENAWRLAKAGDVVTIPGNVRHALRNSSTSMMKSILVSKKNIYNFFRELAMPLAAAGTLPGPASSEVLALFQAAAKYDHWLGSPEENAAIGISLQ